MKGIYIVGNYPDREKFIESFRAVADAGYDFIEVGIPFNDPVADGPVIAAAVNESVKKGVSADDIIDILHELKDVKIKKYIMTYANIVYSYGIKKFSDRVKDILDGIIIADLPNRMRHHFSDSGFEVPIIPFATLETRDEDIEILKETTGDFVYFVGIRGVTGSSADLKSEEIISKVEALKKLTNKKVIIGFGIKTRADAHDATGLADGFVAGTEAVKRQKNPGELKEFLKELIS
jgi:tryptophan synthase alpha chain